jgi:hypothetical protein
LPFCISSFFSFGKYDDKQLTRGIFKVMLMMTWLFYTSMLIAMISVDAANVHCGEIN